MKNAQEKSLKFAGCVSRQESSSCLCLMSTGDRDYRINGSMDTKRDSILLAQDIPSRSYFCLLQLCLKNRPPNLDPR